MSQLLPPAVPDHLCRFGEKFNRRKKLLIITAGRNGQIDIKVGDHTGPIIAELLDEAKFEFFLIPEGHDVIVENLNPVELIIFIIDIP